MDKVFAQREIIFTHRLTLDESYSCPSRPTVLYMYLKTWYTIKYRSAPSFTADFKRKTSPSKLSLKKNKVEKVSGSGLTFEDLQIVYSRLGNEGLIAILAQPPSSSPTIAILTSDHHASNFSCNSQVLQRKHPVLGIKLNPLSLLFQLARYHRNDTDKRLQKNGFRTLQRNHMFSVALCIIRMRAWWLARVFCSHDPEPRVFFGFLWRQRS